MQPAQPHDDNSKLDALVAQYLEAVERGEQPDREQFLQQHPDFSAELKKFFADLDKVQAAKENVRPELEATIIPQHEPKPGAVISGRYKLLENIGEGGMGSVWVAEQQQPVKRRVAIKLVKAGMDSKQVLARFEAERQALAVMDHPNIAKVFDGGMTEQGRPYFVMEYVKGVPFTDYCDKARLSLRERLNLFIPVCQAVQHAHHKGIVHRDLKPSNILICLYDGKPVPKVIDFGLAKAMHQSLTEQSIYTGHGIMVGTPLYMSPEQAEHNNLDVDTRTDIYSLGVVLYELLVGTTPLERQQLQKAAFEEVLRLIKEVEPPRPSMRLSTSASLPSIAAQRSIDPKQLSRSVAGDLDWIVMKSLEKERSRRYDTANGLARDIERFLNDEAVEACPPSRAYRLKKFLRKHRGQVIAASVVLLVLIAGITGTTLGMYQAIRAERASKLANQKLEKHSEVLLKAMEELYAESNLPAGMNNPLEISKSSGEFFDGEFRIDVEFKNHEIVKTSSWVSPDADPDVVRAKMAEELRSSLVYFIRENQKNLTESVKNLETANATLARSLTHAIGYGTDPAPPELKSLADWSALTDSNLKLQTLEVALEDPETALRIARRADRVIQACVALSPTRRAKAIELVSAKQRDMAVDPRVRMAACWLAVELAADELPALEESIAYLGTPWSEKNPLKSELTEFVIFTANRVNSLKPDQLIRFGNGLMDTIAKSNDSPDLRIAIDGLVPLSPCLNEQQIVRAGDSLIVLLESSTDAGLLESVRDGIAALAPRLSGQQITRCWNATSAKLETLPDSVAGRVLAALAPTLPQVEVNRGLDQLLQVLQESKNDKAITSAGIGMAAIGPRIASGDVTHAWDQIVAILAKSTDAEALWASGDALMAIVPTMPADKVQNAWQALSLVMVDSTNIDRLRASGRVLEVLGQRLTPDQVGHCGDALIAAVEKATGSLLNRKAEFNFPGENTVENSVLKYASEALLTMAQGLSDNQVTRCQEAYLAVLEESHDCGAHQAVIKGLAALGPRLSPEQVASGWDKLAGFLGENHDTVESETAFNGLTALAPRLPLEKVMFCWDTLLAVVEKPDNGNAASAANIGLLSLVDLLPPNEVTRAWEAALTVLDKSTDSSALQYAGDRVVALAPRLAPDKVAQGWDSLIINLRTSKEYHAKGGARRGLLALSSRLAPDQIRHEGDRLIAIAEISKEPSVWRSASGVLVAMGEKLTPDQRMKAAKRIIDSNHEVASSDVTELLADSVRWLEATAREEVIGNAMTLLLDMVSSSSTFYVEYTMGGMGTPFMGYAPVRCCSTLMANPKTLGRLLLHPGCVGEPREWLLERFEELVFHDGKHVFLTLLKPLGERQGVSTPSAIPATSAAMPAAPANEHGGLTPNRSPSELPPRRFHNLHDAAAWIQQNWPDFDLEATHPVIWRGER